MCSTVTFDPRRTEGGGAEEGGGARGWPEEEEAAAGRARRASIVRAYAMHFRIGNSYVVVAGQLARSMHVRYSYYAHAWTCRARRRI